MIIFGDVSAVLLDMDGTLVDSEHVSDRCWTAWARRRGKSLADVLVLSRGRRAREVMHQAAPELTNADLDADVAAFHDAEMTDTDGVAPMAGAVELLRLLEWARIPHALVTSAGRPLARVRMEAAGLPFPDIAVCGDEAAAGKPAPDGYVLAADLVGVPIADCVVIEDAPAGFAAGRAAGARVIAVGTVDHPHVDASVATLLEITPSPATLLLESATST